MIRKKDRNRLEKAINGANHSEEVPKLAKNFRDNGMEQKNMYSLFSEFQQIIDPNDIRYDSIVDTMDLICSGPWAKGVKLYDQELTSDCTDSLTKKDNE